MTTPATEYTGAIQTAKAQNTSTNFPTDRGTKQGMQPPEPKGYPVPPSQYQKNQQENNTDLPFNDIFHTKKFPLPTHPEGTIYEGGYSGGSKPHTSSQYSPTPSTVIGEQPNNNTSPNAQIYRDVANAEAHGYGVYATDTGLLYTGKKPTYEYVYTGTNRISGEKEYKRVQTSGGEYTNYFKTAESFASTSIETPQENIDYIAKGRDYIFSGDILKGIPFSKELVGGYNLAENYLIQAPATAITQVINFGREKVLLPVEKVLPNNVFGTNIYPIKISDVAEASKSFIPTSIPQTILYGSIEGGFATGGGKAISTGLLGLQTYGLTQAQTPQEIKTGIIFEALAGTTFVSQFNIPERIGDVLARRGLREEIPAEYNTKPFYRNEEVVFMRRYEGVSFDSLKGFSRSVIENLKGYEKGQFIERQYLRIPHEVMGRLEGKETVSAYFVDTNTKAITFETRATTRFPYYEDISISIPELKKINQELFYSPRGSELNFNTKEYTLGYHATPNKIPIALEEDNLYQTYFSLKGVSGYFLRLGAEEEFSKGQFELFSSKKPTIIGEYFKDIEELKPIREIKIPNPYDENAKPIKQYKFNKYGIEIPEEKLLIPKSKMEVEGVARTRGVSLGERTYFKLFGRSVIVEERLSGKNIDKEINVLLKTKSPTDIFKSSKESYLPSVYERKSYLPYNISSLKSYGKSSSFLSSSNYITSSKINSYSKSLSSSSSLSSSKNSYSSSIPYLSYRSLTSSSVITSPMFRESKKEKDLFNYYESSGKRKSKKQKRKAREDIAITPSFTAQILGVKRTLSRKQIYGKALGTGTGAEIRGVLKIK